MLETGRVVAAAAGHGAAASGRGHVVCKKWVAGVVSDGVWDRGEAPAAFIRGLEPFDSGSQERRSWMRKQNQTLYVLVCVRCESRVDRGTGLQTIAKIDSASGLLQVRSWFGHPTKQKATARLIRPHSGRGQTEVLDRQADFGQRTRHTGHTHFSSCCCRYDECGGKQTSFFASTALSSPHVVT